MRIFDGLFRALLLVTGVRIPGQRLLHVQKPNDSERMFMTVVRQPSRWRWHTAAVFGCLVINTVYAAITNEDTLRIASDVGVCMQYCACVLYFATDHFDRFADDTVCVVKQDHVASMAAATTLLSVVIGAVVDPIPPFEWWHITSIVTDTFGRYVALVGLACASVVLFEHVKVLRIASMVLEQRCWDSEQSADVSTLLRDLVRIRASLVITSEIMHAVYAASIVSCATMLGIVLYESQRDGLINIHVDTFRIVVVSTVCLALAILAIGVYLVQEEQEEIGFIVRGAEFADTFLLRADRAVPSDTSTTLEWYVMTQMLREEWFRIEVLGISVHSGSTLKQITLSVAAAFAMYQSIRNSTNGT